MPAVVGLISVVLILTSKPGQAQDTVIPHSQISSDITGFRFPEVPYLKMPELNSMAACNLIPQIAGIPAPLQPEQPTIFRISPPEGGFWPGGSSNKQAFEDHWTDPVPLYWIDSKTDDCRVLILNPVTTPPSPAAPPEPERPGLPDQPPEPAGFFPDDNIEKYFRQTGSAASITIANGNREERITLNKTATFKWRESPNIVALYSGNNDPGIVIYEDYYSSFPKIYNLTTHWHHLQLSLNDKDMTWQIDNNIDPLLDFLVLLFDDNVSFYRYTNEYGEVVYVLIDSNGARFIITKEQIITNKSLFFMSLLELLIPEYFGSLLPAGGGISPEQWQKQHRVVSMATLYRLSRILSEYDERRDLLKKLSGSNIKVREAPKGKGKGKGKKANRQKPKRGQPPPATSDQDSASGAAGLSPEALARLEQQVLPLTERYLTPPPKATTRLQQLENDVGTLKTATLLIWLHTKLKKHESSVFNFLSFALRAAHSVSLISSVQDMLKTDSTQEDNRFKMAEYLLKKSHFFEHTKETDSFDMIRQRIFEDTAVYFPDPLLSLFIDDYHDGNIPVSMIIPAFQVINEIDRIGGADWVLPFLPLIGDGINYVTKHCSCALDLVQSLPESALSRARVKYTADISIFVGGASRPDSFLCNPKYPERLCFNGTDWRISIFSMISKALSVCGKICTGKLPDLPLEFPDPSTSHAEKYLLDAEKRVEAAINSDFQLSDQKVSIRFRSLAEAFTLFWKGVASDALADQKISGDNAIDFYHGFLGCMEVSLNCNNLDETHNCFRDWRQYQSGHSCPDTILMIDDNLRTRMSDTMALYCQRLRESLDSASSETDETRLTEPKCSNLQAQEVIDFLRIISTAISGVDKGRLMHLAAGLDKSCQQYQEYIKNLPRQLEEQEAKELKDRKAREERDKRARQFASRKEACRKYLRRQSKKQTTDPDKEIPEDTDDKETAQTQWLQTMEKAADFLIQGAFREAVALILEPAYSESNPTLRLISLSELALIHIQRLREFTRPLTISRKRIEDFESVVNRVDKEKIKAMKEALDQPEMRASEFLELARKNKVTIYDRASRISYLDDIDRFIQLITENKEEIEKLTEEISEFLASFYAFIAIERISIDEETFISYGHFLQEAIEEYKADIDWLNERKEKIIVTFDSVKEINRLTGIYANPATPVQPMSEETHIAQLSQQLTIALPLDRDFFTELESHLPEKE